MAVFELVDCERLATLLAEDAWMQDTKNKTTQELYNLVIVIDEHTPLKKEVKEEWEPVFSRLKSLYLELINTHKKQD